MPVTDCRLDLDTSPLLGLDDHRKYQLLLGMLQWMINIGKLKLFQLCSSLNRFGACPRQSHLELDVRSFGYVKNTLNKQIAIESRLMPFQSSNPNFENLIPDFLNDYPEAT